MGSSRSLLLLRVLVFLLTIPVRSQRREIEDTTTEFIFRGFSGRQSEIRMEADATVQPGGLLRLTDQKPNTIGTTFYRKPVRLLESHRNASVIRSFSTSIVFAINPKSYKEGGYGFTFTLSPTPYRRRAGSGQYMGLLNNITNGNPGNHVFAVEFDTVQGYKDGYHRMGNHIGVNFNNLHSDFEGPVLFYKKEKKEEFLLQTGDPIKADISYEGYTKLLNVTVYPAEMTPSPVRPTISRPVPKLSRIVEREMYVGFTAATGDGERASAHYVMGWSFSSWGEHPEAAKLDLSDLPRPPTTTNTSENTAEKSGYSSRDIGLILALSAVTLILIAVLIYFFIYKNRGENLDDWEVNHPHRMSYKELHSATDGFSEERIIGSGGFGTVFRGSLSSSLSDQIAVKKITEGSEQGIREFVAEIESLGRLSHKNLVKLRGWCKRKSSMLLVYDYIPNGSLESLLHSVPRLTGTVLSWTMRLDIAKGIASGLLYLHEEGEQIRDIKSSNVLIDEDMNPRLGDFGLARLYERGSQSHTTVIVGTPGYMAPELTSNGYPSTASDVYSYGVLLLEIVSGVSPIKNINFKLPVWIMAFYSSGNILNSVDKRLQASYDRVGARTALLVGLLCCHPLPEYRPSIAMVLCYLNEEQTVPNIDETWGVSFSSTTSPAPVSLSGTPSVSAQTG